MRDGVNSGVKLGSRWTDEVQNSYSQDTIFGLLDLLISKDPDYEVSSFLPELQLAIEYSRRLYNLEDVSEFPVDSMVGNVADSRICLTDEQRLRIRTVCAQLFAGSTHKAGQQRVISVDGSAVAAIMRELVSLSAPLRDNYPGTIAQDSFGSLVDSHQIEAFEKMSKTSISGDMQMLPIWSDVVAANVFQLVYLEVLEWASDSAGPGAESAAGLRAECSTEIPMAGKGGVGVILPSSCSFGDTPYTSSALKQVSVWLQRTG